MITAKIEGLDKTLGRLSKLPSGCQSKLLAAVNKATGVVEASAKAFCPVSPGGGNLRGSIHPIPAKVEGDTVVGYVHTNVEYAIYVEFGTGRRGDGKYPYETKENLTYDQDWPGMVPQPYLGRSLNTNEKAIQAIIRSATSKAVDNV